MGLGSTFRKVLLADAAVVALVATRVYPKTLPQAPTFPAITFQRISRVPMADKLDAPGTLARPRVQVDVWGKTDTEVDALATAVRHRLNGFKGTVAGEGDVQRIALDTNEDLYDAELQLHRHRADYFVWHEED